ncbi:MAG: thiamine pyrophosphate-dependent dehydrogenase E1 component subunit alpha [Clostridia bacterium]|nr:thiamine pyrophosphate-dependent dehydrogenase E1 component subunit alpha [Clostridia bacterium]MCL6522675.1 thiamine pyrophosphate-dependent dehydrogenase E1 component subunit alpha [Bacillota bacterium]
MADERKPAGAPAGSGGRAPLPAAGREELEALGRSGLGNDQLLGLHRQMVRARLLDQRMWQLNRQGLAPFVISAQGHEAAQVGAGAAFVPGHDFFYPYYRDYALALAIGFTPYEILLGLLARAGDPASGARQMPGHFNSRRLHVVSQSSPVGTQIPQAVGTALASKLRGEDAVTYVSFGDGTTAEGDFHEGLNFAAIHRLPVVFFCENNQYAISEPLEKEMAVPRVADRAAAYGMPGASVDGNDVLAVYRAVREAVERARAGGGPTLVEAVTYRTTPHSSDDDDRTYRTREEVEAWKARDPIPRFEALLRAAGLLDEAGLRRVWQEAQAEVDAATDQALAAPEPDPGELTRHLFYEGKPFGPEPSPYGPRLGRAGGA